MEEALRVIVADARWTVANEIAQAIGQTGPRYCIEGIAQDGTELLQQVERLKPHAVIFDSALPVLGGLALYTALREAYPDVGLVMMCDNEEARYINGALLGKTLAWRKKMSDIRSPVFTKSAIT